LELLLLLLELLLLELLLHLLLELLDLLLLLLLLCSDSSTHGPKSDREDDGKKYVALPRYSEWSMGLQR
jgi:hypothetical protein